MKIGRKVPGSNTYLGSMTGPRLREYIDLRLYTEEEAQGPYRVSVGFQSENDWYQAISITLNGARTLRDNLDRALSHASVEELQ